MIPHIAPGYLSARACMELVDDIQSRGVSLTYEVFKDDVKSRLTAALEAIDETYDLTACVANLRFVLSYYLRYSKAGELAEQLVDDYFDKEDHTFDFEEVITAALESNELCDYYQPDEEQHVLNTQDFEAHTSWLGGALNVWIPRSDWVTNCYMCSICVPGSGNLDQACGPEEGNCEAYCPHPDEWSGWTQVRNLKTNEIRNAVQ